MKKIQTSLAAISLILISTQVCSAGRITPQIKNDPGVKYGSGFYVGGGIGQTITEDCGSCDADFISINLGYDSNSTFGVEFIYGFGETDYSTDVDFTYAGINIGDNFNTTWFKLYGKIGVVRITEESKYESNGVIISESYGDTNPAIGIGFTISPMGRQKYFQIKFDVIAFEYGNGEVTSSSLAVVYKF